MNSFSRQICYIVACFLLIPGFGNAAQGAKGLGARSAQTSQSPAGEPFIEIPQVAYNFGEVLEGTEIEHGFQVKNKGMEILHIDRVKTG